jgi:hypothetical protein
MNKPEKNNSLLELIILLIDSARRRVAQTVNSELTLLYWRIGKEINDNILLLANGLNLFEAETYRYAERKDRNISFRETGRLFTLGVRVKF